MTTKILKEIEKMEFLTFTNINKITKKSGIYFMYQNDNNTLLYVGKSGKGNGTLYSRIRTHYSGSRGSDQFCLYVFDKFLKSSDQCNKSNDTAELNGITKEWIRDKLSFKYIQYDKNAIDILEKNIIKLLKPPLNKEKNRI